MKTHKNNLQIDIRVVGYIIVIGIAFYSCENTLFNNSNGNNYGVVINEINYHSLDIFNTEDWVEIHNLTDNAIDIGGWEFKDENDDNVFTIPETIILPPRGYLVLCEDIFTFTQKFPNIDDIIGDLGFGLDGDGEMISLFDSNGLLVDIVEYNDTSPWPIASDGNGPTLELLDPSLDNSLGENWSASNINGGTPGEKNSVIDE